jgi:hypothetical protein
MYSIFTGSSDRLPFQVMTNKTAFMASAHLLGAHWDWSGEETCMKMIMLCNVTLCGPAERYCHIGAFCLYLVPWRWRKVSLEHWYLSARLHGVTHQKAVIFIRLSDLTRCRKFTSILHIVHNGWTVQSRCVSCRELGCVMLGNWSSVYDQVHH